MGGRRHLAVVGHLANLPEALDVGAGLGDAPHRLVAGRDVEHHDVLGQRGPGQAGLAREDLQRGLQRRDRGEVEIGVAPLQRGDGVEAMVLERLDEVLLEARAAARGAEGPVLDVAAGTAGDLADLGRVQTAVLPAVELALAGEGHVVDVEVEAHADRVGGDEVVDVAVLVHRHLGVAGARRERPQHHGGPPALPPDQFGDGVDLVRREGHDGGAVRQARQLLLAREGEVRQARPIDDGHARQQPLDHALHGRGAEHQRLVEAPPMQEAVGEDVAAVEIRAELDLVDGHEGDVEVPRHRLDGADPVARVPRLDLLLAGDQRDLVGPHRCHDAAVDLAGEQPQRQPDDAGRMGQHAFDGEMRLAGVGRAEDGRDGAGPDLVAHAAQCAGEGARRGRATGTTFMLHGPGGTSTLDPGGPSVPAGVEPIDPRPAAPDTRAGMLAAVASISTRSPIVAPARTGASSRHLPREPGGRLARERSPP